MRREGGIYSGASIAGAYPAPGPGVTFPASKKDPGVRGRVAPAAFPPQSLFDGAVPCGYNGPNKDKEAHYGTR